MSREKERTDVEQIKAEVQKYVDGGKAWKVMACGHREYIYLSVNETREVCWACKASKPVGQASNPA